VAVEAQPPPAVPMAAPGRRRRLRELLNPKRLINGLAGKALEAADVVLSSIPAAAVAAEIKDVVLIAIKD
jgi:hypothetical protein